MTHSFWITQNTRRERRYDQHRSDVTIDELIERIFEQDEDYRETMEVWIVDRATNRCLFTLLFKSKKLVAGHGDNRFEYATKNYVGFPNDQLRMRGLLEKLETW